MALLQDVIRLGTRAAQPGAGTVATGTLYYVTDEGVTERSNGVTWDNYADGGSPYTDEQAQDAVGTILTDTAEVNFTYNDAGNLITADLIANSIAAGRLTFANTQRLDGRNTAGAGAGEEVTIAQALAWTGGPAVAWTSYTPTWTASVNPAIGNGTLTGAYLIMGKTLFFRIYMLAGTTTTFGTGEWSFGLPTGVGVVAKTGVRQSFAVSAADIGTAWRGGHGYVDSAATAVQIQGPDGGSRWGSAVPHTWANTDYLELSGVIEID